MRSILFYFKHVFFDLNVLKKDSNKYFLGFFFFYFILGCLISYQHNVVDNNFYFGADTARAYGDLTDIFYNHYRIKVHPLFLLLTQPITLLINGLCNNPTLAVIVMQSLCSAFIIKVFYKLLSFLNLNRIITISFPLILGFSFSFMIYSTTPETFIFSGLASVLFFFYLVKHNNALYLRTNKNIMILCGYAAFLSGMVLTNYALFIIGVIVTLLYNNTMSRIDIIKYLFKLTSMSFLTIIILTIIQKIIWNNCPVFLSSIFNWMAGENYEETYYINTNFFSVDELWKYFLLFFVYPLVSPSINLYSNENISNLVFTQYRSPQYLIGFLCLFFLLFIFLTFFVKVIKRERINNFYPLVLGSIFLFFNFLLHFLYGKLEAFIYSCNYLYLILLCIAITFDNVIDRYKNLIFAVKVIIFVFVVNQLVNNLHYFNKVKIFTHKVLQNQFHISDSIKVVICYSIGIIITLVLFDKTKTIRHLLYSDPYTKNDKRDYMIKTIIFIFYLCLGFELISILLQAGGITGFLQSITDEFHMKILIERFIMVLHNY